MIRCFTLFDITRINGDYHAKNQLRNWHTIIQALTTHSTVTVDNGPKKLFRNIDGIGFGSNYSGFNEIWVFDFEFNDITIDISAIENTINLIPMISGLTETVKNLQNYTITNGPDKNICFLLI